MKNTTLLLSATVITATSSLLFGTMQAASASALTWDWSYSGTGITANGTGASHFGRYTRTGKIQ